MLSAFNLANNLDPDQDQQNVGPDLDPNYLTLSRYSSKNFVEKKLEMCQCDTDAPTWGFCVRKTVSLFIWDGMYQWDRMYVLDRTYRQGCCYMQGHKNQQMTKDYTACKEKFAIFSNIVMGGSTGGTHCPDPPPPPPLENHKLLYVCFEVWVWAPLEKHLNLSRSNWTPLGPIASRGRSLRLSVKYFDD